MAFLEAVPVPAVIVAAVLVIGSSSSLAVVLLAVLLAASGMTGPGLGIALALGGNLGRGVAPMIATFGHGAVARRTTVGNLLSVSLAVVSRSPLPSKPLPPS